MAGVLSKFRQSNKDQATSYMWGINGIMLLFMMFFLIFPSLFKAWTILVQLIFFLMQIFIFAIFISALDEGDKRRNKAKTLLKASFVLFATFIISVPLRKLQYNTGSGAVISVWIIGTIMAVVLSVVATVSDPVKKALVKLEEGNFLENTSKVVNPGDIVLCNNKEELLNGAKDPREILPKKDRFLHMLIIGPTGCGKTSQVILPMVRQDLLYHECGVTVLEPKGDLAIKAAMMARHCGRKEEDIVYFDPSYANCPKFNPLAGREVDVVENIATTFRMLNPDSATFFQALGEQLMRNAIKVLKRLDQASGIEGKFATLINLSRLLQNSGGQGRELVNKFSQIPSYNDAEAKENADIATWFLNDYFPERSKVYENTSGIRSQVAKLVSNEYLREVLNPDIDKGERNEINFDVHLDRGTVICISTAQGALRDLSKYLGYFIILSLQSSVFRRPGTENDRRPHFLYIDEFQTYSTPGFSDMLTQGRSYRVASILATQARDQMAMGGGRDGKAFVNLVSTNARNIVLFPGINKEDAKFYSETFGEYEKTEIVTGVSQKRFNLITGGLDRLGHPTESMREQKKMTANFSPTDLIFGSEKGASFMEIVYCLIKNNSIQPAKVGKVTFIPSDLNTELDAEISEYSKKYVRESAADYYERMMRGETEDESKDDGDGLNFGDSLEDLDPDTTLPSRDVADDQPDDMEQMIFSDKNSDDLDPLDLDSESEESLRNENSDDGDLIDNTGNIFDGIDDLLD